MVVFSRLVGRDFRLMARRGRRPARPLPVAPAGAPFDVEVARDTDGRLVVAFARCRADGLLGEDVRRRSCRLGVVEADGRGRERPLGPAPARGVSHRHPALQGGRLAYMRTADKGGRAEVLLEGRVVIAREGAADPDSLLGLDLARYGMATAIGRYDDLGYRSLYLRRPGRQATVMAEGVTGEENDPYVMSPSFSGPFLYWGYANHGAYVDTKRSYVFRRELRSGATTATRVSPYVTSVATDAGRPLNPVVVTTDTALDSPQRLDARQSVRTLHTPRYRVVPRSDLVYP